MLRSYRSRSKVPSLHVDYLRKSKGVRRLILLEHLLPLEAISAFALEEGSLPTLQNHKRRDESSGSLSTRFGKKFWAKAPLCAGSDGTTITWSASVLIRRLALWVTMITWRRLRAAGKWGTGS